MNGEMAAGTSVIIVGGGPVGLALAIDLGWRGIPCLLVEQSDGSIYQPKMDGVNVRTMEFCRRWGLVEEIQNCPYPRSYPQDMVYLTSMTGYELGRETFLTPSGGAEERRLSASPEVRIRCPQNMFDPILRRFAESLPTVTLKYRHQFKELTQTDQRVEAVVQDMVSEREMRISGRYLVGCDGAGSTVRSALGINMAGPGALTFTTNVIFRCPRLIELHDKQLAYRHIFIGEEGTWATLVAINGRDEWRFSIIGSGEPRQLDEPEIRAKIVRAVGREFDFQILSIVPWVRRELVAERYGQGRVFLAGDSVHVMSPTGGFGMNTGIADAVDLSWKLTAVLQGWGGAKLLDSYDIERRPVGQRVAREASGNLLRTLSPGSNPGLLEKSAQGALLRYAVGRRYAATVLREWYSLSVSMGYTYADSPICWTTDESGNQSPAVPSQQLTMPEGRLADGTRVTPTLLREWHRYWIHQLDGFDVKPGWPEIPAADVMIYRQSARPGARAPHAWLADGRSTLDLFGKGFTLLRLRRDAPSPLLLQKAAARRGLPLTPVDCFEDDVYALYRRPLVLVRPDGHVAWRGDDWPKEGIDALVERIRGS